jgi:NADPH2 dehydrogenase
MQHFQVDRFTRLDLTDPPYSKPSLVRFRNRVVVPPMASQTASQDGFVTQLTLDHYARLGLAQAALIIVEYSYVHPTGRSEENQLGVHTDGHVAGLRKLSRLIKASGALAGLQVSHAGGKSESALTGGKLLAPSAVAVPVKGQTLQTPIAMTDLDRKVWLESFLKAAGRAVAAGFDLLEIHAAHGYGFNQWLSPLTNHRLDADGANQANRARLLIETVQAIKGRHPQLLISVRIPGQDFLPGGLTITDATQLAQNLELAGADLLHVSSGIGGWRRPSIRVGEGYLVAEAALIQAAVRIPVIGVGGIESGAYIDAALRRHDFTLAAVGRAILKDPSGWARVHLKINDRGVVHCGVACPAAEIYANSRASGGSP